MNATPFTIYLTHHSHCDLGYTHDLPVVRELQRRYIDDAIDLAEKYPDGEIPFRWTCEVTSIVEHWLESASPKQIRRFKAAAKRGQIEVCALWCNLTPLADMPQLAEMFNSLRRLKERLGISAAAGMNSDVNGFSWALADQLLDLGIRGFTMSINEHFGTAPKPFPGLLHWVTPTGRTLPVYNGPTYAHTAWLGMCSDLNRAFEKLSDYIGNLKSTHKWPRNWAYMQITHHGPQNDNMGPIEHLVPWLIAFNKLYGDRIRLELTTPSRFFETIRDEKPDAVISGEWNDYWAFGEGSTPYETALFRRASSRLADADLLSLLSSHGNSRILRDRAFDALAHYIEHTWGADCSIHKPDSEDARNQARHKEQFAYNAWAYARLLHRDGLSGLAGRIDCPAQGPAMLLFNATPYPRRESVRVPRRFLESVHLPAPEEILSGTQEKVEVPVTGNLDAGAFPVMRYTPTPRWPNDHAYQHFVDRPLFAGEPVDEIEPLEIPPYGWVTVTPECKARPADNLVWTEHSLGNGAITLQTLPGKPGLASIKIHGKEWTDAGQPIEFGNLITEEIEGTRSDIMVFDDSRTPIDSRKPVWNPKPPVKRTAATLLESRIEHSARRLRLIQTLSLPGASAATLAWTLSADHNDLELELEIKKTARAEPHSIYLALPLDIPGASISMETPGLVVDSEEAVPNRCPWFSIQGAYAIGNPNGSAIIATPDVPMVIFRRLPLGESKLGDKPLDASGLSFLWIYNNYWETNFKADASGTLRFRFRLAFSKEAASTAEVIRLATIAAHPVAYHPLPQKMSKGDKLPDSGSLLDVDSDGVRLALAAGEDGKQQRLVLSNPENRTSSIAIRSRWLRFRALRESAPDGSPGEEIPIQENTITLNIDARSTRHFILEHE